MTVITEYADGRHIVDPKDACAFCQRQIKPPFVCRGHILICAECCVVHWESLACDMIDVIAAKTKQGVRTAAVQSRRRRTAEGDVIAIATGKALPAAE